MIRKILTLLGSTLAVLAVLVPSAAATPSIDVDTDVTGASADECSEDHQTWTVTADITITNTWEDGPVVIKSVSYLARFVLPGGDDGVVTDITVVDDGGLAPGATIPANESATYAVVVQLTLPCGVDSARISPFIKIEDRHKIYHDFDEFISDGTPVPVGVIGAVVLAAFGGAGLALAQHRRTVRSAGTRR